MTDGSHRVVIVGGGFGGLYAARALRRAPVSVTLVDRRNFHLFQPLLYQVATGALSPANIAAPLRSILKRQKNTEVLLGEAVDVDVSKRRVILRDGEVPFDTLMVAAGVTHSYFGHDAWESLAGALGEIAHHTLRNEFRLIDPSEARILLIEGADRVLPTYAPPISVNAVAALGNLHVEVASKALVTDIREGAVVMKRGEEQAMQEGKYAARTILRRLSGKPPPPPFRYLDFGSMATIGRGAAVAEIGPLRLSGGVGWLVWLFIHLMYIVQFGNRLLILLQWAWSYVTWNRSARLITGRPPSNAS